MRTSYPPTTGVLVAAVIATLVVTDGDRVAAQVGLCTALGMALIVDQAIVRAWRRTLRRGPAPIPSRFTPMAVVTSFIVPMFLLPNVWRLDGAERGLALGVAFGALGAVAAWGVLALCDLRLPTSLAFPCVAECGRPTLRLEPTPTRPVTELVELHRWGGAVVRRGPSFRYIEPSRLDVARGGHDAWWDRAVTVPVISGSWPVAALSRLRVRGVAIVLVGDEPMGVIHAGDAGRITSPCLPTTALLSSDSHRSHGARPPEPSS